MIEKVSVAAVLAAVAGLATALLVAKGLPFLNNRWRRGRRTARISSVLALVTLVGTVAMAEPAFAASYQSTANVVSNGYPVCAQAHVYINNTSAYPHLDAYGEALNANYIQGAWDGCGGGVSYRDAYQLRTREDLYVSNGSGGWYACSYGPWIYNSGSAYIVGTQWNPIKPPCANDAWYFDSGYGGYYNGSWLGGWTQTPNAVYVTYP